MVDDLKILKVKQLNNQWSDLTQIDWNEDDLKILKVEYLNNHLSDLI